MRKRELAGWSFAGLGAVGELVDWLASPEKREALMGFLPEEHLPWITYGLLFVGALFLKHVPADLKRWYLKRPQEREERIADIALKKAGERAVMERVKTFVRLYAPRKDDAC